MPFCPAKDTNGLFARSFPGCSLTPSGKACR
jgi:hypothetical protein